MIIPRYKFQLALKGETKSLPEAAFPLSGESANKVLWIVTPRVLPGWTIVYRSTHSWKHTLRHLLLKFLFQELNKNEMVVIQMLAVKLTDEDYEILEMILSNHLSKKVLLARVLQLLSDYNYLETVQPAREFLSFEPRMEIQKVWTQEKRIPPKRYIGVGYNDHGTLSTAPSWKDQLSEDGEVSTRASLLKFHLKMIFDSSLYRISSQAGRIRLTSSKRAK